MDISGNSNQKEWTIGDVHGNYRALKQVLERSGFNYEDDLLITLGDITDGHREVYECVEELLKIKHRIDIEGNHDRWFTQWLESGVHPQGWEQGGEGTVKSYAKHCLGDNDKTHRGMYQWHTNLNPGDIPESHKDFFRHQVPYHIDENNNCFVHGGFNRHTPIREQPAMTLLWDRDLFMAALTFEEMGRKKHPPTEKPYTFKMKDEFNEVFLGHTSTQNWSSKEEITMGGIVIPAGEPISVPMHAANIWNLDTGAGYDGPLTIMNVETHEYFQSDTHMYPGERGR